MSTLEVADHPDGVRCVTLNRPEARNALRRAEFTALIETLAGAAADDNVRVLLLAGRGPTFCAGGDLKETGEIGSTNLDDHPVHELTDRLAGWEKPLVAAAQARERTALAGQLAALRTSAG